MAFEITNVVEELVIERVLEKLGDSKEFDHDQLEDIACLALNRVPAHYVRYAVDAAAALSLQQHDAQDIAIDNAVEYAIDIVRTRRHEKH
jgi:competence protein ComFB